MTKYPQPACSLAALRVLLGELTFSGGKGAALMGSMGQASLAALAPGTKAKQAVALNAQGITIARSDGFVAGANLLTGFGAVLMGAVGAGRAPARSPAPLVAAPLAGDRGMS